MSMDAWQKLLIDEEERDLFFVGEELREMQQEWITAAARDFARRHVFECELMEEGLAVVILVDDIIHTDDRPFCDDKMCPCHAEFEAVKEMYLQHFDGLLTKDETIRLYHGENI